MNFTFHLSDWLMWLAGSFMLTLSVWAGEPELTPPKVPTPVPAPAIHLKADGTVEVNGVVLRARAGTREPEGLEKAVLHSTFKTVNGLIQKTWAEKTMGILVHTEQGPQNMVPRLRRLEIGVFGLKEGGALQFRGTLELRGHRLDFSKPWRHGPKDLDTLKRPNEPKWGWSNEGRNLDFMEGPIHVFVHAPPTANHGPWLTDVTIVWPQKE